MTTDRQDRDDHTPNGYVPGGYGGTGRSFRFADRVAHVRFPVTKPQSMTMVLALQLSLLTNG